MAGENCGVNIGSLHEYALSAPAAATGTYSQRFTTENFGLKAQTLTEVDGGSNGTIWDHVGDQIVVGVQVTGGLTTNPKPDEILVFLKNILGGSEASGVITPGPQCDFFQLVHYDKPYQKLYAYNNLVTASAELTASDSARMLKLNMNIEGQSKTETSKSSGNLGGLSALQPFQLREAVLTLNSANVRMKQFSLGIDNGLAADDWFNSLTRTEMPTTHQVITLHHDSPWDRLGFAPATNQILTAAATLVFTSQGYTLTFNLPNLVTTVDEPEIPGRTRIMNGYTWRARSAFTSGTAAPPMTVTLVTP